MNLRNLILEETYSTVRMVSIVGSDSKKVEQIYNLFFEVNENGRLNQRASCILEVVAKEQPQLITTYLPKLVTLLSSNLPDRYIRNSLRILQYIDIPEKYLAETTNICFDFLADRNQPVAIQAFSMTVLLNTCKRIPELKNELQLLIEEQFEESKPAFKSRGRRTLKELKKI